MRTIHKDPLALTLAPLRLAFIVGVIVVLCCDVEAQEPDRPKRGRVEDSFDTVPHTLKWVIGFPRAHPGHLQDGRTENLIAAATELMRHAGLRDYKGWLAGRLSEEWFDEKENPPPPFETDPFEDRRGYQAVIKRAWEPTIEAIV